MLQIIIYTTLTCPYCASAKDLLSSKGVEYTEYRVDEDPSKLEEMLLLSNGSRTVPQIFINDQHVGGFDDLKKLQESGDLAVILGQAKPV